MYHSLWRIRKRKKKFKGKKIAPPGKFPKKWGGKWRNAVMHWGFFFFSGWLLHKICTRFILKSKVEFVITEMALTSIPLSKIFDHGLFQIKCTKPRHPDILTGPPAWVRFLHTVEVKWVVTLMPWTVNITTVDEAKETGKAKRVTGLQAYYATQSQGGSKVAPTKEKEEHYHWTNVQTTYFCCSMPSAYGYWSKTSCYVMQTER